MTKASKEPLISVIVPVYKVEEYLDKCVESIVDQTYRNLEIILVDDGSPDNCPKMCDEWAKKDKRIKVIHKENGGLSDARNAGIDIAKGEYITFIDSDDTVSIDFIESNLFNKIKNIKFDVIVSNPPYIETNEIQKLPKDVRQEPMIALDGGKDGLDFYRKIYDKGNEFLNRQGYICVEIGYNQREAVKRIIEKKQRYVEKYCIKDLCENDRVIVTQIG